MNKRYTIFALCFTFSIFGMDLTKVSDKDSENFSTHLKLAIKFGEISIQEGKLPAENPMHVILERLNIDLLKYNGDIRKKISSDQCLIEKLKGYHLVDENSFIKFGLDQINKNVANIGEAKQFVVRYRLLNAGLDLTAKYPTYSNPWMGEVQKADRINYMLRNKDYPLTDDAIRDYIAMFIYQVLFAPKVS